MDQNLKDALAGFELYGSRQLNNTIKLDNGKFIEDWPEEIELFGGIYTKENIIKGAVDADTGEQFENAQYV